MKNQWLMTRLHWVFAGLSVSLMPACDSDLPADSSESSSEGSSGSDDDGTSTNGSTGEASSSSDESTGEGTSSTGSESSTATTTSGTTTDVDDSGTTGEESITGTSTGEDTTTGSEDSMTESSTTGEDATATTGSEEESTAESSSEASSTGSEDGSSEESSTGEDTTTTSSDEESTAESSSEGSSSEDSSTGSEEESTETTDCDNSNNCEGWQAFAHENVWEMEVKIIYRNRDVPDFIWENYVSEEASPSPLQSELKYTAALAQYDWDLPYLVDRVPPLNYLVQKGEVDWQTTTVKFEQEHGRELASVLVWFPSEAIWQVTQCRRNVGFTARYEYIYDMNSSEQPDDPHVLTFELSARIKQ